MKQASQLQKGDAITLAGQPHVIQQITAHSPSARGGTMLYKFRARNLLSGQNRSESCKGDQSFEEVEVDKRPVQYMYRKQGTCFFLDQEDSSDFQMPEDTLEEELNYLLEDMELNALVIDGAVRGLELPDTIDLQVTETTPAMKGASATARTKPATLQTGLIVQVPEYLAAGEVIKVDTRTAKFLGRA